MADHGYLRRLQRPAAPAQAARELLMRLVEPRDRTGAEGASLMPDEIRTCARCGNPTVSFLLPEPIIDLDGWEITTELACIAPPQHCEEHPLIGRDGVERGEIETLPAREPAATLHVEF